MVSQLLPVPTKLKLVVKSVWILESDNLRANKSVFKTMADGCPGLIYQATDKGIMHQGGKQMPETFIFGQTTKHAELSLHGNFSTIGISFYPNALKSVFKYDAAELTDSCVDIDLLSWAPGSNLSERAGNNATMAGRVNLITDYLSLQLQQNQKQQDKAMQYALDEITLSQGKIALTQLQDKLGMSERNFQRNFKQFTGIPPKLYSRICRFQASLKQLQQPGVSKLTDVAFVNDYADQSHFIRSFKEFAGLSPLQYQKQANPVIDSLAAIG